MLAAIDDPILKRFRAALDRIYGDRIERVVLFGSRARGDNARECLTRAHIILAAGVAEDAARTYLEAWGKPVAFYSNKHGVFWVSHPGALGGDGMTQVGRALLWRRLSSRRREPNAK